jgi:glycosyltransferase involved in cell wall biosynthesis
MPCYPWSPMGGFKVVYEYANQFVARGHEVTVVHPREITFGQASLSLYDKIKKLRGKIASRNWTPDINWHLVDPRVKLTFVPDTDARYIPDGDAIFATAWTTAPAAVSFAPSKGTKFYLIQHYETFMGPKELVDATWRAPLRKIVISKWLLEIAKELGVGDVAYIPNAIDHDHYRTLQPVRDRKKRIAMLFSHVPFKGSKDGIAAIEIAKKKHPDLSAVFFGTGRPASWIPDWIPYHRTPPQDFIVRDIYNQSSIFLSPSLSEGFALPPAEAACCGCAVVASNSGGIADFIEDGKTGLLSAPSDPEKLGQNLCRLLDDENLRVGLAEACAQNLAGFTWEKSARSLEMFITSSRVSQPICQLV